MSKLSQISGRLLSVEVLSIAVAVDEEIVKTPGIITHAKGDPITYHPTNLWDIPDYTADF